ncbi:hypothetical protein VB773_03240 [Haloarculaceae archaeon H-GB2-1]|nr:hypothetical protein [Haloarculaceae archaeon H-GB1-1]MEA5406691.1 hypothetical protein [Haloarculaceae archaeon H-GB2-1]
MNRALRYLAALLLAAAVSGGVSLTTDSVALLVGIFVIYAVTTAIALRYPTLVWGGESSLVSGVFGGGATFGGLMLADGVGADFHFAAAMLGLGLAGFGLTTGFWMLDATNSPEVAARGEGRSGGGSVGGSGGGSGSGSGGGG